MRQRPNRTIDLTATEVAMGDEDDPPPQDSVQPPAATPIQENMQETSTIPPAQSTAMPDPEPARAEGGTQSPPNQPPIPPYGSKWQAWLPSPFITWPLLEAGAAGGALVLLVVAVLWFAGLFAPGDNGLNDVNARLAQVELRLKQIPTGAAQPSVDPKAFEALSARLGKLEAAPPPAAADPAIPQRLAATEAALTALQAAIADVNKRTEAAADAVRSNTGVERGDMDALNNRLAALEKSMQSAADDLDKRIATLGDRPLRLAVAAQALRAAVERGDAYAAELAAVKPLAGDARALAPLESFAATGVPSAEALARELADIMPAMQRLATPPAEGGFLDRLQANAGRLVRIRPIDDVPGDDPAAVLARIEAKAGHSDIAGALAEFAKLPPPIRAPAENWVRKAEARDAAVAASRRLAGEALAALGQPAMKPGSP
jgi:hypothetical protein